jgi:hypothetical protein
MTIFYFPENEKGLENVVSFSPLDRIACERKPFGDIAAEEYLEFSKMDLMKGDNAGLVNALSNAKRCFHYQVDKSLFRYALKRMSEKLDFPDKLGLLSELGIMSGTLLRIFNRERNVMEHEYAAPKEEIVRGSIDLCDLLLLATERFLQNTPGRVRVTFRNDKRDIIFFLEPGSDKIQFFEVLGTKLEKSPNGEYFGEVLFQFGIKEELREGITLRRKEKEDLPITLANKEKWIPLLRIFSLAARDPKSLGRLPDEPMVMLQQFIPLSELKKAIDKMAKQESS